MKFAVAAASLAFLGFAAADDCTTAQQASAYTTLANLLTLSSFQGCVDDSGYSLLYSTSLPSDEEYVAMCASDNCQSLISSIIELNPPDCTLTVPTSGLQVNVYDLANGFSGVCSSSTDAPTTDAPTTDAPTTDGPTTDAPTTDGPSTDAPATTTPAAC